MSSSRDAAGAELLDVLAELGHEERGVLLVLARRLLAGQRSHGRLDLGNDRRDWRKGRAAELVDVLLYAAVGEVAEVLARPAGALEAADVDDDEGSRGDLVIVEVDRAVSC